MCVPFTYLSARCFERLLCLGASPVLGSTLGGGGGAGLLVIYCDTLGSQTLAAPHVSCATED